MTLLILSYYSILNECTNTMLQDTFAVKKILMHNDYDPIIIINDIGKYFLASIQDRRVL